MTIDERARRVKLLLMDCDGVLTDGCLYFSAAGEQMKAFHVRDGQGIAGWHAAGYRSGIISGRDSGAIIRARADELGIKYVYADSSDKSADLEAILNEEGVTLDEVAFIGDDIGDVPILNKVGFSAAVADASVEAKSAAHFVTSLNGGHGAVRQVIDLLLAARSNS